MQVAGARPRPWAPRAAAAQLGEPAWNMQGPVQQGLTQTTPAANGILAWEWLLNKAQRVLLAQGGQGQAVGIQPWRCVSVGVTLGHPFAP